MTFIATGVSGAVPLSDPMWEIVSLASAAPWTVVPAQGRILISSIARATASSPECSAALTIALIKD